MSSPTRIGPTRTVVFVHGMFMTPACWDDWRAHFEARGWTTHAPAWPEHDAPIAAQRQAHPNPKLAALTLDRLVEEHAAVVGGLDEPPLLVGHSMGGLIVQLLLQRGFGVGGVAIDSAPPKGVISLAWSFLKSNWGAINPFASVEVPIALTPAQFAYAFTNALPPAAQQAAYERHYVPESRRVGKGPTTKVAAIDYSKPRAPLLLVAGGADHIIPASLNRKNFARYGKTPAITSFHEFPGRCHYILGQEGWQEVADYALSWVEENR